MALWHWKYELVEYLPKLSNAEVKPMAKDNKKELLEAAIYRNTSKQKLKQNSWNQRSSFHSKTEDCRPAATLKMKSFTAFFKDLGPKLEQSITEQIFVLLA